MQCPRGNKVFVFIIIVFGIGLIAFLNYFLSFPDIRVEKTQNFRSFIINNEEIKTDFGEIEEIKAISRGSSTRWNSNNVLSGCQVIRVKGENKTEDLEFYWVKKDEDIEIQKVKKKRLFGDGREIYPEYKKNEEFRGNVLEVLFSLVSIAFCLFLYMGISKKGSLFYKACLFVFKRENLLNLFKIILKIAIFIELLYIFGLFVDMV